MKGFCSAVVLLLALVSGVSSFVIPVPCARAVGVQTTTPSARRSDHVRPLTRPSHVATTGRLMVLAAAPRGGGENGGDELEEKAGIEPKCELLLHPVLELELYSWLSSSTAFAGTLPSAVVAHAHVWPKCNRIVHSCADWRLYRCRWI